MKFKLWALLAIFDLLGCKHRIAVTSADVREFQPLKPSETQFSPNIKLSFVDGVSYRSYRDHYDWGRGEDDYHSRIEFPNLTQTQFDSLKRAYGFGLSQVVYKPSEVYDLRDFLTPMMQAVLNQRFRTEINENYIYVTSNCWSTAYEALRSARANTSSFKFFVQATPEPMRNAFTLAASSQQPLLRTTDLKDIARVTSLSFGDVVLQYDGQGAMEHAALVVDRNLFFEKTAIITESPYRLVHIDDWAYAVSDGGYIELWRIDRNKLKDPAELFKSSGLKQAGNSVEKTDFPLLETEISWRLDQLGRARLDETAFHPLILKKPPGYP